MSAHETGHPDGQAACDRLLAELRARLPAVDRKHAKAMCAFHQPQGPNFAYVYHLKTKSRLDVWFPSLATEHFEPLGSAQPVIRKKLGTPWADSWAWHFEIASPLQAAAGSDFLLQLAKQERRATAKRPRSPSMIAEELPETLDAEHLEGAASRVFVNRYERDPKARARCIKIHGAQCMACGFAFGEHYGSHFSRLIVVHHVRPLASIGKAYRVDPEKDLVPLCPNCHLVVHQRTPPYSVDEVRQLLSGRNRKPNPG